VTLVAKLHPLAEVDVIDAWKWYEEQSPGLGDRFLVAVEAAIQRATRWPNAGTPVVVDDAGGIVERKVASLGFPFAIRYRVTADLLIVMAVYHQHRHPRFGSDRAR
jgi:plasmid stabilization system protein ParE